MAEPLVLVVDDEPGIIRLCERLLHKASFRVKSSNLPDEAVVILERDRADILLVDIRMPGMDGFQLMEIARQRQPDLAVVVMTGFGTVETAIEALRRGADGLVLKPFSGNELIGSVRQALEASQQKQDILRLHTLRPLFQLTTVLFTQTDPGYLQDQLLEMSSDSLRCSIAGIYQLDVAANVYRLVTRRGDLNLDEEADPGASLIGRAGRLKTAVLVNRISPSDPAMQAWISSHDFSAAMCAPITLNESDLVLMVARKDDESGWRAPDLEFFAILARQAGVALENASLHAELRATIRQLVESQHALIQAEKMAVAGRLTASIAHEINNPLQSVENCLHLARRKELPRVVRQNYLDLAQDELQRLMNTVQRMLEYYRPGALDRKPVDLNDLIERVVCLVESQLKEHNIQVQTRFASQIEPVLVVGDQIQQVLLNLVLNAMEAMPEGGMITIETASQKGSIEVWVEDTGPGVPPDQREQIFEPFISTKESGTGLGLAVSYGIISAHGGSLELVDGQGTGACFRIRLPVEEAI